MERSDGRRIQHGIALSVETKLEETVHERIEFSWPMSHSVRVSPEVHPQCTILL